MKRSVPLIAIGVGLLIVISAGTGASAARLITGSQIAPGTITGANIKNGSITSADVQNGSLKASDFAPSAEVTGAAGKDGAKGDKGDPGVQGPPGPAGSDASATPDHTFLWARSFTSDGTTGLGQLDGLVLFTSTESVPADSLLDPDSLEVSGLDQGCDIWEVQVQVLLNQVSPLLTLGDAGAIAWLSSSQGGEPKYDQVRTGENPGKLQLWITCSTDVGGVGVAQTIPDFRLAFKFSATSSRTTTLTSFG